MRVAATLLVAGAALLACGSRAHLTESHGRSYNAAFARQGAEPAHRTRPAQALTGLDSQEASIVATSYRRSLAPRSAAAEPPPVLMVAPESSSERRAIAPSVPK
jgi:hypothetical protein